MQVEKHCARDEEKEEIMMLRGLQRGGQEI